MIEILHTSTRGRDADAPEGLRANIVRIFVHALGLSSYLTVYLCVSILSSTGSARKMESTTLS
jgi:hypothetical protein